MKKNYTNNLIFLFLLLFSLPVFAQDIAVSGKVFDNFDEMLPGVSVLVHGTTISTQTDEKGSLN